MLASANPVEIEGVWYNLIPKAQIAEVTKKPSGKYSGDITIPDKFTYNDVEYSVTKIEDNVFSSCDGLTSVIIGNNVTSIGICAFYGCSGLTSINIGNSVTSIGELSFYYCSGLSSVTIPNSVTSIDDSAFRGCSMLTSVHISDIKAWCGIAFKSYDSNPLYYAHHLYLNGEEIKDLVIPNSVKSIGDNAFSYCSGLISVSIPNSVISIGSSAFRSCSGLTSVAIPNSVTSIGKLSFYCCSGLTSVSIGNSVTFIGDFSFYCCSGLTSVTIGNSVTSIGNQAFGGCSGLTSVTIPNSVTDIFGEAFYGCSSLTSVTMGNSMKYIAGRAFGNCELLTDVYCLPEKVRQSTPGGEGLYTDPDAFADSYQEFITLHVPATSAEAYGALAPWKSFKEIVGLNGEEIPATPKCATPTISLVDGKITFSCETEGVEYISEVTVTDVKKYYDNEISAPKKFKVTVYAAKASYDNSDTATAEFDFSGDTSLSGDVDGNGIVNVADHVKLSSIIMEQVAQ